MKVIFLRTSTTATVAAQQTQLAIYSNNSNNKISSRVLCPFLSLIKALYKNNYYSLTLKYKTGKLL